MSLIEDIKTKESIIDTIIGIEGGYVNDPSDSGRATNYGVTESVARDFGYTGKMQGLPRKLAFQIYEVNYWNKIHGSEILNIAPTIAEECMDTSVNTGVRPAIEFLQRSLNILNDNEKYYKDLKVDGYVGSVTVSALKRYILNRKEETLLKAMNCLQGAFYIELAERRPKDERFVYGWLRSRVVM